MSMFSKIFIGLVIVFLLIVGAKFLLGDKEQSDDLVPIVTENFDKGGSDGESQEFIRILRSLEKVTLSPDLFASQVFQSLEDFSPKLQEEPRGRANPFRAIDPTERSLAISLSSVPPATTTSIIQDADNQ